MEQITEQQRALQWIKDNRIFLNITAIAKTVGIASSDLRSYVGDIPKKATGRPYKPPAWAMDKLLKLAVAISFDYDERIATYVDRKKR